MSVVDPSSLRWAASVWGQRDGETGVLGSAVLIAPDLLLTCAHVAQGESGEAAYVMFPHVDDGLKYDVRVEDPDRHADLALLRLINAKAPTPPARIRSVAPDDLSKLPGSWAAFGYSIGDSVWMQDPDGFYVDGRTVRYATSGKVVLDDPHNEKRVVRGFSGTGVWSPAAGPNGAVVAVVAALKGDEVKAVTIHRAIRSFPQQGLDRIASPDPIGVDDTARAAWRITEDATYLGHWDPRSRGVMEHGLRGNRFSGRRTALSEIRRWLSDPTDRRILTVTGSPGVGKSAVLARVVITSDPVLGDRIDDGGVKAPTNTVQVAVHAQDKSPEEVAALIADAAFTDPPDLAGATADVVAGQLRRQPRAFTVLVDAIDEAKEPHRLINQVLLPLAETDLAAPIRLIVGTRPRDYDGDLLAEFGSPRRRIEIDLDDARYFAFADMVEYALMTLQQRGAATPSPAYADITTAYPVAEKIARVAEGNFLVAGLLAHDYGFNATTAVRPDEIGFDPGNTPVRRSLQRLLDRIPPTQGLSPAQLLTPLAYAEAPGLPVALWRIALQALFAIEVEEDELTAFASGSAANFLIESTDPLRTFRLFHEALNETILEERR